MMKRLQCFSLSLSLKKKTHTHLFTPLINHQFLPSHRFVWASGAQSAAVQLQHLTEVGTSALKLFIIAPQASLSSCQHDEGLPAVPYRTGQKAQNPTQGTAQQHCCIFAASAKSVLSHHVFLFILCVSCLSRNLVSE